ncbi:MAG: hypothetical protein IJQ81_06780 [Oscillibacter sp.]|nr:hypothetical protein [Oscillibacter sp.]
MNNRKITDVYKNNLLNRCFEYRDKIIALREKIERDFDLKDDDKAVLQNYAADGIVPTDPEDLRQYTIGKILNGLDCAWPGLEEIIEFINND